MQEVAALSKKMRGGEVQGAQCCAKGPKDGYHGSRKAFTRPDTSHEDLPNYSLVILI